MLTNEYYDAFAVIIAREFRYNRMLAKRNIISKRTYILRMDLMKTLVFEFIEFMKNDNSSFDEDKFKLMCEWYDE